MPVTASAGSMPAFCMNLTFSAIPPTFAGVTRLTNDDASCASTVLPNGRCRGTLPACATAEQTYVTPDSRTHNANHLQSAERMALTLSPTLASWGRST